MKEASRETYQMDTETEKTSCIDRWEVHCVSMIKA